MLKFNYFIPFLMVIFCLMLHNTSVLAQTEVQAWGNLTGIRVDDQIIRFESSLRMVYDEGWHWERATAHERNWTRYSRNDNIQLVHTHMDSLFFTKKVKDINQGKVSIEITTEPKKEQDVKAVFFHLNIPAASFKSATVVPVEPAAVSSDITGTIPTGKNEVMRVMASGVEIAGEDQKLKVLAAQPIRIIVKSDPETGDLGIYFTLLDASNIEIGKTATHRFEIEASSDKNHNSAHVKVFPQYPGNEFLGFGGNFRLQNPKTDPPVIDYLLNNMDVRMGRLEMPWQLWHPDENTDPIEAARKGDIHPHVKASMEMAKRLHDMGMPVLLAGWFPPQWAAVGVVNRNPRNPDGTFGNQLRQDKAEQIYESITSYIVYLKEEYGVDVVMFSFNESDLGINVRQTPEEHATLIKGLGAYMKSKGLITKILLGDTADANGFAFMNVALDDPETWEYIGAVSFHSWRGWERETLMEWYEAADRLDIPLIIGEGSIDAAAWRYPAIFEESHYALNEIKLYIRIIDICQPQSILQWQLTADYSPLKGGGVFGNDSIPLQPTQRFWNLKQLSETPAGLHILPVTTDNEDLFVAALGNKEDGQYVVHMVNEGPAREVVISGIPNSVKGLQYYVTNEDDGMKKGKTIKVKDGKARVEVEALSFVSLMSE